MSEPLSIWSRRKVLAAFGLTGLAGLTKAGTPETKDPGPVTAVNYNMFGAVGDGKHDDGTAIKMAHAYANQHQLPVVNLQGEFWIKNANQIDIRTSTQWGQTIFHIDESLNEKAAPRFLVRSNQQRREIKWDNDVKKAFLEALKPGVQAFEPLTPYRNCLVIVKDDKDRIGFRAGARFTGQSWAREEFFYVEEHGRILGDIAWEFNDYTSLVAYPCDDSYLVIEGGTFYLSGNNPGDTYNGYYKNGFSITRSRTIIRNQWVGLEGQQPDVSLTPRSGFYSFSNVFDVTLENVRLLPWEQDREGKDRDVGAGTYGISAARMLNGTFRNVTAEGGSVHWGVFGTNLVKNFRIERCNLNRVDVHFHGWNVYIKDSRIGYRGISVTGGGDLFIENTGCSSRSFVNFRRDFGAKWDGDIRILNCRFIPATGASNAVLYFQPADAEYGYPLGFGRSIRIADLRIDYEGTSQPDTVCWLMDLPKFSKLKGGQKLFFPESVVCKDIAVYGREKGVRLMNLHEPQYYGAQRKGSYDGQLLQTNARMLFERVQLEEMDTEKGKNKAEGHLVVEGADPDAYTAGSFYPDVAIVSCRNFRGVFNGFIADISFGKSTINSLLCADNGKMPGRLTLSDSSLMPNSQTAWDIYYSLETVLGTNLVNCVLHAPVIGGQRKQELLHLPGLVKLNEYVKFNHLGTRLGNEVIQACRDAGTPISKPFIEQLKNHSDLEE